MDRLGRRALGVPARDLPPFLARGGRAGGRRPVRHQCRAAGDVHDAAAARLRRDADPGRAAGGPLRAPERDAHRRDRADAGPGRLRPRGVVRRGAGRARVRRHGRRDDLDLPAPAGHELVHRPADPVRDRAVRDARPARRDRRGRADDLGAGPPRLDQGLPDRRRGQRGRDRGGGDRRPRRPRGPGPPGAAAHLRHHPGQPAGLLGPSRHPAGLLDALRHPVQRRRDDPALGLPVLRQGRATSARPGPASC